MKLKLKKFRGVVANSVLIPPYEWKDIGDVQDVPDAVAHEIIGKYPDMFEGDKAAPESKMAQAPENKMAAPAAAKAPEKALSGAPRKVEI